MCGRVSFGPPISRHQQPGPLWDLANPVINVRGSGFHARRRFIVGVHDIAPGDRSYVVTDSYTLPVDAKALSIHPHAHLQRAIAAKIEPLARELRAQLQDYEAREAAGSTLGRLP